MKPPIPTALAAALVLLAPAAAPQGNERKAPQGPPSRAQGHPVTPEQREQALWTTVHNRFTLQMDVWFNDGDFPRCIQLLRIMHAKDPHDYETVTDLGWMLGNIQKHDEELALYQKYRAMYPDDKEAPYPEAEFYFRRRQYDKVIPLLEPVLPKRPHPNSYRMLAHSYDRTGRPEEAARVWREYLKVNPNDETAKRNLKRVEEKIAGGGQGKP
ncbi:MAG: tetratricopeptide repeat protein [Fimbriimonadales bacterium]|nr:tetratricopeptide repeat protein [Fimbriimonadales bacterium]